MDGEDNEEVMDGIEDALDEWWVIGACGGCVVAGWWGATAVGVLGGGVGVVEADGDVVG